MQQHWLTARPESSFRECLQGSQVRWHRADGIGGIRSILAHRNSSWHQKSPEAILMVKATSAVLKKKARTQWTKPIRRMDRLVKFTSAV